MKRVVLNVGDLAYVHFNRPRLPRKRRWPWDPPPSDPNADRLWPNELGLYEGRVVHVFELNGQRQHVVELDTPMDPILEVRNEFTISDDPNKPIGLWRRT